MSISWDKFTAYMRGDNNKAVLHTIAGDSYGECTYAEMVEKLEKISRNNKAWSTRKLRHWEKHLCRAGYTQSGHRLDS